MSNRVAQAEMFVPSRISVRTGRTRESGREGLVVAQFIFDPPPPLVGEPRVVMYALSAEASHYLGGELFKHAGKIEEAGLIDLIGDVRARAESLQAMIQSGKTAEELEPLVASILERTEPATTAPPEAT